MLQTNYIAQQIFFEQQNLDKMEECECKWKGDIEKDRRCL